MIQTLIILLLLYQPSYAGMDFTKFPSDNTQIVGTNEVAFVKKQSDILTAYLSVCIVVLVPSKGMAHFLPLYAGNMENHLFTMLSWIAPDDEVIIVPSGEIGHRFQSTEKFIIAPDKLSGFLRNRMGIKNVKIHPCNHDRGRTVRISEDYWNVIEHDTVGAYVHSYSHVVSNISN